MTSPSSPCAASRPSTARSRRLRGIDLDVNRGRDRHPHRLQRRRQVDPDDDHLRHAARPHRPDRCSTAPISPQLPTHRDRPARHCPVAGRAAHLPAHDRAGESADGRRRSPIPSISTRTCSASSRSSPFSRSARRQRGGTLSGGEQQMLAIARALDGAPAASLARRALARPRAAHRASRSSRSSASSMPAQGMTVFLVEQNAFHALKLAHRAYVMVNGRITMIGHRPRASGQPGNPRRLSRRRQRTEERTMSLFVEDNVPGSSSIMTVVIGGGAAFLAGRALASQMAAALDAGRSIWSRSAWRCAFSTIALFNGELLSAALFHHRHRWS